jgi:hypothetical protein
MKDAGGGNIFLPRPAFVDGAEDRA